MVDDDRSSGAPPPEEALRPPAPPAPPGPPGPAVAPGSLAQDGYAIPPPPYPQAPAGVYQGFAATSPKAGWALGLSIAAWVVCPVIAAVVALVLGGVAKSDIRASGGRLTGRTMATAAQVISVVHLGLVVIAVIILIIVAAAFTESSSEGLRALAALT